MEITVNDTNILIDLANTGLLDYCGAMDIQFYTTDIAINEIRHSRQEDLVRQMVESGALKVEKLQGADLFQFALIYSELEGTTNLTPVDCSVMLLAEKLKCRLLTSDQKLKRQAEHRGITVNGFLWLIDRMMELQLLPPLKMAEALQVLLETNDRAPRDLVLERIDKYLGIKQNHNLNSSGL